MKWKRRANTRMRVPYQKKTDGGLLAGGLEQKGEGGAKEGDCVRGCRAEWNEDRRREFGEWV